MFLASKSCWLLLMASSGNWAEKVANLGLALLFWPPFVRLRLALEAFGLGLELNNLLRNEFFLSKLFFSLFSCTLAFESLSAAASSSAIFFRAFAASFLDSLKEPPLELVRLFRDFLDIRNDWLLSRLNDEFGDEDELEVELEVWRSTSITTPDLVPSRVSENQTNSKLLQVTSKVTQFV